MEIALNAHLTEFVGNQFDQSPFATVQGRPHWLCSWQMKAAYIFGLLVVGTV